MTDKEAIASIIDNFIKAIDGKDEAAMKTAATDLLSSVILRIFLDVGRIADALEVIAKKANNPRPSCDLPFSTDSVL